MFLLLAAPSAPAEVTALHMSTGGLPWEPGRAPPQCWDPQLGLLQWPNPPGKQQDRVRWGYPVQMASEVGTQHGAARGGGLGVPCAMPAPSAPRTSLLGWLPAPAPGTVPAVPATILPPPGHPLHPPCPGARLGVPSPASASLSCPRRVLALLSAQRGHAVAAWCHPACPSCAAGQHGWVINGEVTGCTDE